MDKKTDTTRRDFIQLSAGLGASLIVPPLAAGTLEKVAEQAKSGQEQGEDVSPSEDLMREHGLLRRVLLIYDEGVHRLSSGQDFDPAVLAGCAGIVRRFVQDYHEKLEENYVFPRLEKAGKLQSLTQVLRDQHTAGRRLTNHIQQLSTTASLRDTANRQKVTDSIRMFTRMYRPHAAREDTVLFPTFHSILSQHEYDALGDEFEDKEHKLFGEDGFEKMVDEVAGIEMKIGLYDLASFTPKLNS